MVPNPETPAGVYHSDRQACAFVDILGYKDSVDRALDEPSKYAAMKAAASGSIYYNACGPIEFTSRIQRISDAVAFRARAKDMENVYRDSALYMGHLLLSGTLCRGGIAISPAIYRGEFISQQVVHGDNADRSDTARDIDIAVMNDKALMSAYQIETHEAKGAVILVDSQCAAHHKVLGARNTEKTLSSWSRFGLAEPARDSKEYLRVADLCLSLERQFVGNLDSYLLWDGAREVFVLDPFWGFLKALQPPEFYFREPFIEQALSHADAGIRANHAAASVELLMVIAHYARFRAKLIALERRNSAQPIFLSKLRRLIDVFNLSVLSRCEHVASIP